jgi:hypothetical protein
MCRIMSQLVPIRGVFWYTQENCSSCKCYHVEFIWVVADGRSATRIGLMGISAEMVCGEVLTIICLLSINRDTTCYVADFMV